MTVPAGYRVFVGRVVQGDGPNGRFATNLSVPSADLLQVTIIKDSDGTRFPLVLGTDFDVTLLSTGDIIQLKFVSGREYSTVASTIENTANLRIGYTLEARQVYPVDQQTSIKNQSAFFAEVHEDAFDKLTNIDKQQQHDLDSSIKIVDPETGNAAGGTIPPTPDSLITFDSDNNLRLIPHDEEVITGRKVQENADDIDRLENTVIEKHPATVTIYKAVERGDGSAQSNRPTRSSIVALFQGASTTPLSFDIKNGIIMLALPPQRGERNPWTYPYDPLGVFRGIPSQAVNSSGDLVARNQTDIYACDLHGVFDLDNIGAGPSRSPVTIGEPYLHDASAVIDSVSDEVSDLRAETSDSDSVKVAFWTAADAVTPTFSNFTPGRYTFTVTKRSAGGGIASIAVTGTDAWTYGWGPPGDTFVDANHHIYLAIGDAVLDSEGNYQVDAASFPRHPIRILNRNNIIGDARASETLRYALYPMRLYRLFTQSQLDNRDLATAEARLGSTPVGGITFDRGDDTFTVTAAGGSGFVHKTLAQIDDDISTGHFLYYIDLLVEFTPDQTNQNILRGVLAYWSSNAYQHEGTLQHRVDTNLGNLAEAFSRIGVLESRPSGGGGGATAFLRIVSVNDGVSVFDSEDTLPDTMTLVLQTDTTIHTPLTVSIQGNTTVLPAIADGNSANAISAGVRVVLTFTLASDLKSALRNVANSNRGTVVFYINGSKTSGGSVERVGTFSIQIFRTLEQTFGTNNLTDILTRGLPLFMRNMFEQVLANLTPQYRPVQIFGGINGESSIPLGAMTMTEDLFDEYKKADWLYIYLGASDSAIFEVNLALSTTQHLRVPLNAMKRATGQFHYKKNYYSQSNSNLITSYIIVSVRTDRVINIVGIGLGTIGPHLLSMVAYVPSYSFDLPETSVSYITATSNGLGLMPGDYMTDSRRFPEFSARPASRDNWRHTWTNAGFSAIDYRDSPDAEVLRIADTHGFEYALYAWIIRTPGRYTVRVANVGSSAPPGVATIFGTVRRYRTGSVATDLAFFNDRTDTITFDAIAGDVIALTSPTRQSGRAGYRLEIFIPRDAVPGLTAPPPPA